MAGEQSMVQALEMGSVKTVEASSAKMIQLFSPTNPLSTGLKLQC